jgi:Flp pilus assembly protein TadG
MVGGLLVTLLLGSMELGRYMFTLHALRIVAADAARTVTLHGSANMNGALDPCTGLSGALVGVPIRAPFLNPGALSITMSDCATDGSVTTVRVTVTHPFRFVVPIFGAEPASVQEAYQTVFN